MAIQQMTITNNKTHDVSLLSEKEGSLPAYPTETTTYTLTVTTSDGQTKTATATVTVEAELRIDSFIANPSTIVPGQPVTLSWVVNGGN